MKTPPPPSFLFSWLITVIFFCSCLAGYSPQNEEEGSSETSEEESGTSEETSEETNPCEEPTEDLNCWFTTGQEADLLLSGIDFNETGGPLMFNHPGGIASDGTRLLLTNHFNNRVLIWNQLPDSNEPPDLVLGQPDFDSNNSGTGLGQLNWPTSVATDGQRIVVADTYNDRLLIWKTWPTENGTPADLSIEHEDLEWPWGVWTDGQRLVATSTKKSKALIWNTLPTQNDQPYDLVLTAQGHMKTPRTITSDGQSLIIADHDASSAVSATGMGDFVWKSFPTQDDAPYDFFMQDPQDPNYTWLQGKFLPEGGLIMLGRALHIWNSLPTDSQDRPDLTITGYTFNGGEPSDIVVAGGRIYISAANSNKVVVYNSIPTSSSQAPDFAIGSPDINTNTLETYHFITNPVPVSNGSSLFVTSGFEKRLSIWTILPTESGTFPDFVVSLQEAPWDNAIHGDRLALAGKKTVYLWNTLPLDGRSPDLTYEGAIGSISFQELRGVAIDDRYFYLADEGADKVYIWEGIPNTSSEPLYILDIDQPRRLASDGTYLAVTQTFNHRVLVYPIADLGANGEPYVVDGEPSDRFNLPEGVEVSDGRLFVADTSWSRVWAWNRIEDAWSGAPPDAVLGESDLTEKTPEIGVDKLFWPAGLSFDGTYLWVGEYKFGNRLLRFTPTPATTS